MQLLGLKGSVRAVDVAKSMGVSTETIRKDLVYLNDKGMLLKEFGGAIAVGELPKQPIDARAAENQEAKNRLALKAQEFISGNNVIFIDSGSTLLAFAKIFPKDRNLAVVTNSFSAVSFLMNAVNGVFFVGGEVSNVTMATSGHWSSLALNSLKIDIAFLGSSGFRAHNGPCSKTFSDVQFKTEVLKNSRCNIVLADSSKFTSNAIAPYCDWSMIDTLITTAGAPEDMVSAVARRTKVMIV